MTKGLPFTVVKILYVDKAVFLYRIKNWFKIFLATRNIFEQYPVLDRPALHKGIADGKGTYEPVLYAAAFQVLGIRDIVPVWCCLFTFHQQPESVHDAYFPLVEASLQHLFSCAQLLFLLP